MWLPVIGILMAVAGMMVVRGKSRKPNLLPASPQLQQLSPDQVLNLAAIVKDQNPAGDASGLARTPTVDLFRHLGPINAARVATMAMSLGGDASSITTALAHASDK